MKSIADVVGINLKRQEVRIIEVKASKEDFARDKKLMTLDYSYYKHCHYFYIMCPSNIIKVCDIPKEFGLLYVDEYDNVTVMQQPKKYTGRLKTLFGTSLKNACKGMTNTLLFYFSNRENKDPLDGKYDKNSVIKFGAIRCPKCKHVTKELFNKEKTKDVKCKHCKEPIDISKAKIREITGFNQTFINKINKLNQGTE